MAYTFPPGYHMRPPTLADAEGAARVIIACDKLDTGESDFSVEELREAWSELDLANDARVVVAPDGQIVACVFMVDREHVVFNVDGYVAPEHIGKGIGARLLRFADTWARERMIEAPPDARVVLNQGIMPSNKAARRLFEHEGFRLVRQFFRMAIDLDAPPPEPVWPAGLHFRTFVRGQDERVVYEAREEAFRDHWGRPRRSFDDFLRWINSPRSDPSLWFLMIDGEQIAGVAICEDRQEKGWVVSLGVRRAWRRRGIALAMLRHAFAEFYRRGRRRVELSVDADSLTGAPRVYGRAGMHVAFTLLVYQKELRPGRDIGMAQSGSD